MARPSVRMLVSASQAQAQRLREAGPRRDFWELAAATAARIEYASDGSGRRGWSRRLLGPHVRQAWRAASGAPSDVVFADGEHVGLPYALAAFARGKRDTRLVMLGHLVSRPWKLAMIWVASRVGPRGVLFVHSTVQASQARRFASGRWQVELIPYQVDPDYWTPDDGPQRTRRPLVLAVGAENRDYATLIKAVEGLAVDVLIAGASHWARAGHGPVGEASNVRFLSEALDYGSLRAVYHQADVVVVPLLDVPNQSGVTTILEAMAVGRPVIVTATEGQREVVTGPLVTSDGVFDMAATEDRGPQNFSPGALPEAPTGLYVAPGDDTALRSALRWVLSHPLEAAEMGTRARFAVLRHFTIERFVARLAEACAERDDPLPRARPQRVRTS
ncbi:MAG: glycosyltransferase family 4 protein [Dehalococcoidia bacterium]